MLKKYLWSLFLIASVLAVPHGEDHSDHDHSGHDHSDHSGHDHHDHSGHDHSDHDHSGHDHSDHSGHDHHDHSGHDHSHDHSGHDHDHSDHVNPLELLGNMNVTQCTQQCMAASVKNATESGLITELPANMTTNPIMLLGDEKVVKGLCSMNISSGFVGCLEVNKCNETVLMSSILEDICPDINGTAKASKNKTKTAGKDSKNDALGSWSAVGSIALMAASFAFML